MARSLLIILFTTCLFQDKAQPPANALDVQHYRFTIRLNDTNNIIKCNAAITVKLTRQVSKVSFDLVQKRKDRKGMTVLSVKRNEQPLTFSQVADKLIIDDKTSAGSENTYTIIYEGVPVNGLIIDTNRYGHRTFFGDNWPNRAHNWLPCNDHLSDKASVEFIVVAPEHYQVISNGLETEEINLPDHLKLTHYEETVPLPTKVMIIGVADFAMHYNGSVNNIPLYSWVYPEDAAAGFQAYQRAVEILPWFEKHIHAYPYKKLANVQSKTEFGGMENANTIFYAEKSVTDPSFEGLLVHETAHQWFGNSVTEKDWSHLWLSEGFATYMAHVYHEEKYGRDSLNKRLQEDREDVVAYAKKRHTPLWDTSATADLMQLLNANSYQKGAWVLHMLRRYAGDSLFWQAIRSYYNTYAGSNADTEDLKHIFEKVTGQNLEVFFQQWVYTTGQPQLDINWVFDKKKKQLRYSIIQRQDYLFQFPLAISVNHQAAKTINIKNRQTTLIINASSAPASIEIDPGTNLLFSYTLREGK